ncbi:carbohydrate kinase family protein [Polymorphospora rubra]|uniref:Sugar kinase n=1 Tax=Polymorphospora rubra TaxID=338584 RepID=A0A810N4Q6_9ACTN|nr:PfkB family carbohydrate kinase [Polymorphospora rubra]BCJ67169.1 sugar kinase [Polymorphospora rubra]
MSHEPSPGVLRPRIVVLGDLVTDVLAVLAGPLVTGSDTRAGISVSGGGQAANTAAWLAAEGTPVTLIGAVGADPDGRARVAELAGLGVDTAIHESADAPTGTVIVLVHDGDRTMVTDRGANLRLPAGHVDAALAARPGARHLHLSAYTLLDAGSRDAGLRALAVARGRGLSTSVDAASAEPLRQVGAAVFLDWVRDVDLLLANADEATVLAGDRGPAEQARTLSAGVRHAVVKLGAAGAVWAGPDGDVVGTAGRPVPVVDATGAGDAFAAGLLGTWVGGDGPRAALQAGAALGAVAVSTVGARPPATRARPVSAAGAADRPRPE